jgi:lysophospholipase L1-like esterase
MISDKPRKSHFMNKTIYTVLLASCSLAACKPNLEPSKPSAGNADFSTYVAVGNSLTAGYADGALYRSGQLNSFPAMLAKQFRMVGLQGDFKQPLLTTEYGLLGPKRVLGQSTDCQGVTSLGPVLYQDASDTAGRGAHIAAGGPYHNMGVPGIRAIDFLFPGYAMLNPYAGRFFASPGTTRPLDEALRINATFFTIWLGSNDVLGYALSGGSGMVGGTGPEDISPLSIFKVSYDSVVNAMTRRGAQGVLLNIPDITTIPYFTTVPRNGLTLSATQAVQLNAVYGQLGIQFSEGANNFIIEDPSVPGAGLRQIQDDELVLLTIPQDSLKCAGWGSIKPIPGEYILSRQEIQSIRTATDAFNQIILDNARAHNLAFVDANSYIRTLASGIGFNGVTFNTTFVSGGAFSLDGVHLTPRGYAIVANEIIRSINGHYGATVPLVDINQFSGIRFP